MTRPATDAECLALQAYAIGLGIPGMDLLRLAYAALGHDSRVAMMPLTPEETETARIGVTDAIEMLAAMGTPIVVEPPAPPWEPGLKPRAVAVLVALRRGPLSPLELLHRISDELVGDTERLIVDMARHDRYCGAPLIARCHGKWYLTEAAVAWLQGPCHGDITVAPEAKISYVERAK